MRAVIAIVALGFGVGCGDSDRYLVNVPPKYVEIARLHHAQCGNCHTRVEPGKRPRDRFESALAKHHTRVKMDDAQWSLLIDYLSQTP